MSDRFMPRSLSLGFFLPWFRVIYPAVEIYSGIFDLEKVAVPCVYALVLRNSFHCKIRRDKSRGTSK